MKDNFFKDLNEGFYTGGIASVMALLFYGPNAKLNFLQKISIPTFVYIGVTTGIGSSIANVLVDYEKDPLLGTSLGCLFSVFANEAVASPVTPTMVALVAAPSAATHQFLKNKNL